MINKLLLISFSKLLLVWLIMYIIIIIIAYNNNIHRYGGKENIIRDKSLFKKYIDQFYITNKYYTFFITSLYIFGIIGIFIFLRYLSINDLTFITLQENIYDVLVLLIIVCLSILVTITLYRSLLIILFEKEVNKLYIYIYKKISLKIKILDFKLSKYIFAHLYLLTYKIGTLTYQYPPYGPNRVNQSFDEYVESTKNKIMFDEPNYVIHNERIINYLFFWLKLAKKYYIIEKLFKFLTLVFRFFLKHTSNAYQLFPNFILIIIFVIELYNREFNHIYLAAFIYIIIKTKHNLNSYVKERDFSWDSALNEYFYNNELDYKNQRIYFYIEKNIEIIHPIESKQNTHVFWLTNLTNCDSIFNNFKTVINTETYKTVRRNKGMYRRFWIITGFILISYYLIKINWLIIILLIPLGIMIYTHYYTYYHSLNNIKDNNDIECEVDMDYQEYEYNRNYNITFWIFTILQGYIFWLLLLKPELIFMDTEILLKLPFNLGNIVKVYNIDEKIMYLFNYFEFYINLIDNESLNKEYIRYILRQINFKDLIDNNVRLKDVQVYVKLLVDNYYINENIYKMLAEHMNNSIVVKYNINEWYILMRNTLLIGVITSTLIYHKNIWIITKQISTSEGIYKLMKDIYLGTMKNKLTYEMLVNVIMKIFKY